MRAAPDLGCSTISFRAKDLPGALGTIAELGFGEIDLGAIPAVVDHVPIPPDEAARTRIAAAVAASGLAVRVVNADPGPLSDPGLDDAALDATVTALARLAATLGAALVVPCGAPSTEPFRSLDADLDLLAARLQRIAGVTAPLGVRLLVEAPHRWRLCSTTERSAALLERVDPSVAGVVLDSSHVVAGGGDLTGWARATADRTEHVQLRDARRDEINLSIGNGEADFPGLVGALTAAGYAGHYSLELETHDIDDAERPAVAARARDEISALLAAR
jgi:sugar phosphate isomerase/epimerase